MKSKVARQILLLALLLVLIVASLAGTVTAAEDNERTISTSGNAEILVAPDRALVTVSVVTENADVKVAQTDNARIMSTVAGSIEGLGIEKKDLKTTGYSIYPVYEDTKVPFGQKVKYYRVTNSLQVTLKDITRTGEVIDTAVKSGANQVDSIEFRSVMNSGSLSRENYSKKP